MLDRDVFGVGGIGHSPNVDIVDRLGLQVLMRPTKFLKIAAPFEPKSEAFLKSRLRQKKKLGIPYLWFVIPDAWLEGNFEEPATCDGHEGRNRMYTVRKMVGNHHQPVCILFRNMSVDDVSTEMVNQIKSEVFSQSSTGRHTLITGSNFRI